MLTAATLTSGLQEVIDNEYLVLGTVEASFWRKESKQGKTNKVLFDALHDFKEVLVFESVHYGWVREDDDKDVKG